MKSAPAVLFRVAGGRAAGLGHVRRCLTLAGQLRCVGLDSVFFVDDEDRPQAEVERAGFTAQRLHPARDLAEVMARGRALAARVAVVDSYTCPPDYYAALGEAGFVVVAIDDLADRPLPAAMVVNGSVGAEQLPYQGAAHTRYLLGPQYLLLRPEFAQPVEREYPAQVRRVLITAGGSDPAQLTPRLVDWCQAELAEAVQDVVIGPFFSGRAPDGAALAGRMALVRVHENPTEMRRLMLAADLALSAGGQTTYELAACGTPAIAVRTAGNQVLNLSGLAAAGTLVWAADADEAECETKVRAAISQLAGSARRRAALGSQGRALVDGRGAERVAEVIGAAAGVG